MFTSKFFNKNVLPYLYSEDRFTNYNEFKADADQFYSGYSQEARLFLQMFTFGNKIPVSENEEIKVIVENFIAEITDANLAFKCITCNNEFVSWLAFHKWLSLVQIDKQTSQEKLAELVVFFFAPNHARAIIQKAAELITDPEIMLNVISKKSCAYILTRWDIVNSLLDKLNGIDAYKLIAQKHWANMLTYAPSMNAVKDILVRISTPAFIEPLLNSGTPYLKSNPLIEELIFEKWVEITDAGKY